MKKSDTKKGLLIILAMLICFALTHYASADAYATYDENDTTSPQVVANNPGNGARGVPTTPHVSVTFSEPMDPSSITTNTFALTDNFGSPVGGEVTYRNRTAAIILFTHLNELTTYVATVSAHVRDYSGNSLGFNYSWSFTTGME